MWLLRRREGRAKPPHPQIFRQQRRFSLRNAPERPHEIEVDLAGIWGDPDAVIAAVRDALAAAGIDPGDFLEAARPAADDDELLITGVVA